MTDPVLHEPTIIDTLDCSPVPENTGRLQAAALLSLLDAYDRKLTRDNFVTLASAALALHTQVGKLYMIDSVRENNLIGVLDAGMLEKATAGVLMMTRDAHTELFGLMRRVVACPTSEDKVH